MEYRDEVNSSEVRLLKILGPISELALGVKRLRHPKYTLTLSRIIEIVSNGGGYIIDTQTDLS